MSTATKADVPAGPLPLEVLGPAPSARHAGALQRLRGHGTSDQLIPGDLFDALSEMRGRHLAARNHLAKRLQALAEQQRAYRVEDAARQKQIEAAAAKLQDSPPDERTPAPERQEALSLLASEAWAAVLVLADRLDDTIAVAREHERAWLADLRSQLGGVREQCAEARAVLAGAELRERKLASVGQWLMRFADDEGGFSISPMVEPRAIPAGAPTPPAEASLSRPYTRGRDWNPGEGAPSKPARPNRPPEPEPEPGERNIGDGVGVVFS